MKYYKLFEEHTVSFGKQLYDFAMMQIENIGDDSFNDRDQANEYFKEVCYESFPTGLINVPDKITLYRVLYIENGEEIDTEELGIHYTVYKDIAYTKLFHDTIAEGTEYMDNEYTIYLLTVATLGENLDYESTIETRIMYPHEYEIAVRRDSRCKIVKQEIIDKTKIR